MLVQFSVGNFRSFKDVVTLSMVASSRKEHEEDNTFVANKKLRLLKNAVLYGANASGKSNLIKAMNFFVNILRESSKDTQANQKINIENYKLSEETDNKPSIFEIIFIHDDIRYRYGFEVDKNMVHHEWLYYVPKTKEVKLFVRDKNGITIGQKFKEGKKSLQDMTRKNALFLSVIAQFNGTIATNIFNWLNNVNFISGLKKKDFLAYTLNMCEDEQLKDEILKFMKIADLGIEKFEFNQQEVDYKEGMPVELKNSKRIMQFELTSFHKKYDKANVATESLVPFNFGKDESVGTQQFFAFAGPILDTLKKGKILIIDEMDASLHPLLLKYLIKLFNSQENNPKNAQLFFVAHDVSLLDKDFFRRDQICFTEKNRYGATELFSLVDYKVRKDASFEKDYMLGKYGATPFIQQLNSLFMDKN